MAEGTVNNPIVFTSEFNKPGSSQTQHMEIGEELYF